MFMDYFTIERMNKEIESAKEVVKEEATNAEFVCTGTDGKYVYFNVVAKKSHITENQIDCLATKTRFIKISEDCRVIYIGMYKVEIWID